MNTDTLIDQKVISKDGTPIAYQQTGSGSPLVLVHGTGADRAHWAAVLPELSQHFTIYALDRRGRSHSGDSPEYAIDREHEDILALTSAIGEPVDVLGHSFGAACVLGAAPSISNLRRLVLYEPPMTRSQQNPQRSVLLERMDQAVADGDKEAVLIIMMRDMLRIPMAAIDQARSMPAWGTHVAAAFTIPRELRCSDAYSTDTAALKSITVPTLFLLGSQSLPSFKTTTEMLLELLPNSQVVTLAGQQHSAMLTAPALFAAEVIRFLCA
jgi:pimeloyl-ACP methyl ester carboxylesterase